MTPTRQNPKDRSCSSIRGTVAKGDTSMGRICTIATAILLLTASWVCAGNFEVLADAGIIKAPTPLHVAGTLVKAEFKSNIKTTADMELETDGLFPEPVSAKESVKAKPAIAFRERSKGMAPPPKPSKSMVSEARQDNLDLDEDLSQDLVISPRFEGRREG